MRRVRVILNTGAEFTFDTEVIDVDTDASTGKLTALRWERPVPNGAVPAYVDLTQVAAVLLEDLHAAADAAVR
jgi:hypothetical protein